MALLNEYFLELPSDDLFSDMAKKINTFKFLRPYAELIDLGINDVTSPLPSSVIEAMHKAVEDMADSTRFHGYGPEQGYAFLQESIKGYYAGRGVDLDISEIFISDGAKSDIGNILDIFSVDNTVMVPDPVYPVYVDTNIMAGREIVYINANEENGFLPLPDSSMHADIIYICSPNNPTGAVYNREQLKVWVDFAIDNGAVILFDAAYESFIKDESLPRSIFEIEGARKCAIELCSLSKTAGFTGTRCGYTIVPHDLVFDGVELNRLWLRRQTTKFNGVPYLIQCGAAQVFTPEGQKQIAATLDYYRRNAAAMTEAFDDMGVWYTGGKCSPYVWLKCPNGMKSWDFFDLLLNQAEVVGTPGAGFGRNGEGFFRLTAFGNYENTVEAMKRIRSLNI